METLCEPNNIKNKSEFIYHAVDFYIGYLASQDSTTYLSKILLNAIDGTLKMTENRGNLLIFFCLSVEMSMMMNILAAGLEIEYDLIYESFVADVFQSSQETVEKIHNMEDVSQQLNGA